jgi:cobalt-zinc-cadmium efflux system outer membrane protein
VAGFLVLVFLPGCMTESPFDRDYVSGSIEEHSGRALGPEGADAAAVLETIDWASGLSEDEAVAVALWNNAQFQSDLLELGFSRAELLDAGLLKNPAFSLLFPVGPKQAEAALMLPIDFFWQRPYRVALAELNAEKVAESLVQNGLALVRDVRVSCARLDMLRQSVLIVEEEVALRSEMANIAAARLQAGDISELEEAAVRLAVAQMQGKSIRYAQAATREELHLKNLLGLGTELVEFSVQLPPETSLEIAEARPLIERALAARPDLRSAELAIETAGKAAGWEKSKIFNLTAVLDWNENGSELGPGLQLELPIFNQNNGGRARAEVQIKRAAKNYLVIQQRIVTDVLQAYNDFMSAKAELELLRGDMLSVAEVANTNAAKSYEAGELSYLELLLFERQLLDARLQMVETEAGLRNSSANLQFATGSRLIKPE